MTNAPEFRTYSMRAECPADVEVFLGKVKEYGRLNAATKLNLPLSKGSRLTHLTKFDRDYPQPDVEIEFVSVWSLEEIQQVLLEISDSHVMWETLKQVPLSQNSLERTYGVLPTNGHKPVTDTKKDMKFPHELPDGRLWRCYSLRFEFQDDFFKLFDAMLEGGSEKNCVNLRRFEPTIGVDYPDRAAEFATVLTLDEIHQLLAKIPDTHVMFQSLRECSLSLNSLERTNLSNPYCKE